ncbi:cation:proton antiporter [Haloimpatiens massiliensis]|uniref:cation:proton antiporter n=1 Tax=Haloimpatiens massiliensis TaxID=1658110 RepID=UPI0015E1140A|nr:cation:proton antiporter [Haloimpatiens massiliensis]
MALDILKFIIIIIVAFIVGKLLSKIRMPSILGWLITGMVLGPHAFNFLNESIINQTWYQNTMHILECSVGLMIGTELVWKKLRKSGKQIFITTLSQSLGTFLVVSGVFAVIFYTMNISLYLAFIFGGIALATAPAPALSIVNEFKTDGPVTRTLIPMAALDDIVGVVVFFSVMAMVSANISAGQFPIYMILLIVTLPIIIGIASGLLAGLVLKKEQTSTITVLLVVAMIFVASGIGFFFNYIVLPKPALNFMMIGMSFSATFSNMVSEKRLETIMNSFNPLLVFSLIATILNLGAPLDYHLILGSGIFTLVYILSRAAGKIGGAYFGAVITKSPPTVKKYLGFTLLPHSGVSLVFTGIAVSVLNTPAPENAKIIQGTIAAAAVINEIIAVLVSKQAFKWAGEFHRQKKIVAE